MTRLLLLLIGLTTSGLAAATPITMNFYASGFQNSGIQFPGYAGPISGSITWDRTGGAADPIGAILSLNLTIAGHTYSLGEVGIANEGSYQTAIGGGYNGANTVVGSGLADDFLMVFNRVNPAIDSFAYSIAGKLGAIWWFPTETRAWFGPDTTTATVPEPSTLPLMLVAAGLGMVSRFVRRPAASSLGA